MRELISITESGGSESAPMQVIAFHGTTREFGRFEPAMIGSMNDGGFLGRGFYFSTSFETARSYAWSDGGRVLECRLTLRNPYYMHTDNPVEYRNHNFPGGGSRPKAIRDGLINHGYDGVICAHWPQYDDDQHSTEIVVFDAGQIEVLEIIDPKNTADHGGSNDKMREHMQQHRKEETAQMAQLRATLRALGQP